MARFTLPSGVRLLLGLFAILLFDGCEGTQQPTSISVTGRLTGADGSATLAMSHDAAAEDEPQLVIAAPERTGDLSTLAIELEREGVAPAVGYELLAVVSEFGISGGGGLTGSGVAGDWGFHVANTGRVAKTSYYWFEDSGSAATFDLPETDLLRAPGTAWLARVRNDESQIRIPFQDTVNDASLFLGAGCLTGGDDPCFDMATLASTLFTQFSTSFTAFTDSNFFAGLGGTGGDGDFRLDYIPSASFQMGPCANTRRVPGFGFVFTGTVIAGGFLAEFDISIPILFAVDTVPAPGGTTEFSAAVLPFDVVGSTCHEAQGVDPILVRATTPLGIGAEGLAESVRTEMACSLLGAGLTTIDCPAGTPAAGAVPPLVVSGLSAMVSNTLTFHHRTTRGGPISPAADFYIRRRNADNRIATTQVIPGTAVNCPEALDLTPGRPGMCMIDLLVLE